MLKSLMSKKARWLILIYTVFYVAAFMFLEQHVTNVHIISSPLDQYIPFCEYFIIPYYLWFLYIIAILIYFSFFGADVKEFNQLVFSLGIGMTIFLFISWVWPNGLDLRPETFPRDNFFTGLVADLYQRDTSTNVFPSIHVYNSVVAFIAINRCKALRKRKVIRAGAFILSTLIILSTVFLKQHSVADVAGAFVMNAVLYVIIYRPELILGLVKKTAVE